MKVIKKTVVTVVTETVGEIKKTASTVDQFKPTSEPRVVLRTEQTVIE